VNTTGNPAAIPLPMNAPPDQIAQFADLSGGNATRSYQTILRQFRDPRRIRPIRLMPRQSFDVLRIQQQQSQLRWFPLQDVPNRSPVNAGALNGYLLDTVPHQTSPATVPDLR
jgi:hypothetical protein